MTRRGHSNSSNIPVELDDFAATLEDVLGELDQYTTDALTKGVKAGARECKRLWESNAAAALKGDKYRKSIHYRTETLDGLPRATVYSDMPGLPHLLEKGHASIGGGRVAGRVHIKPAAKAAGEVALETAKREMGA